MPEKILTADEVIQKITDALSRSWSNEELADFYNSHFARTAEKMVYNKDETFSLEKVKVEEYNLDKIVYWLNYKKY